MQQTQTSEFEQLAYDTKDELYNKAIHLTNDTPQAEALVQSTFSRAFAQFHTYQKDIDFKAWLFGILDQVR